MKLDVLILRLSFVGMLILLGYLLNPFERSQRFGLSALGDEESRRFVSACLGAAVGLLIIGFEMRVRRASLKTLIGAAVGSILGIIGAFLIGVLRGKLSKEGILQSLLQATRTAAAVFTVLIGALCFGYFLTVTQTPQHVTEFLTGLGIGPYGVLALILLMYLVLGCLMDAMAMIILTVPIVFPVVTALGFDPIWFGIIIVMTVELGLIHPPVGMNVFVIKSVIKDVNMSTIFAGVLPFVATDLVRLALLIAFPLLATWLPQHMGG